jgi:hypothetical protein
MPAARNKRVNAGRTLWVFSHKVGRGWRAAGVKVGASVDREKVGPTSAMMTSAEITARKAVAADGADGKRHSHHAFQDDHTRLSGASSNGWAARTQANTPAKKPSRGVAFAGEIQDP